MKIILLRLWLLTALLLAVHVPSERACAQVMATHGKQEECFSQRDALTNTLQEERQRSLGNASLRPQPMQRIGGSRSPRLQPTHGGKPGRGLGHCVHAHLLSTSYLAGRLLGIRHSKSNGGAALPRYYYVIALRRILC